MWTLLPFLRKTDSFDITKKTPCEPNYWIKWNDSAKTKAPYGTFKNVFQRFFRHPLLDTCPIPFTRTKSYFLTITFLELETSFKNDPIAYILPLRYPWVGRISFLIKKNSNIKTMHFILHSSLIQPYLKFNIANKNQNITILIIN